VTPASAKDRTIDGPESAIASPMITKMPVPMIAPMPSAVRSSAPTARFSPSSLPASRTSVSVGLRAKGPRCVAVAMPGLLLRGMVGHAFPAIART
jgi:hypothetical protein